MPEFTDLDCVQKKLMLHQFYLDHLILACVFPTKGKPKIPSKNHCKLFSVLENCCLIFQPCRFFKSSFLAFTIFCVADKLRGKPNIFTFQTLGVKLWNQKETKEFLYVFFDDCALQEVFINFLWVEQQNPICFSTKYATFYSWLQTEHDDEFTSSWAHAFQRKKGQV